MIFHASVKTGHSRGWSHVRFYSDACYDVTLATTYKTEEIVVGAALYYTLVVPG